MPNDINLADFNVPSNMASGTPLILTTSYTQIHSTPSGRLDEIYVWFNNPTATAIVGRIRFGSTGSNIVQIRIPPLETRLILPGIRLQNSANNAIFASGDIAGLICMVNVNMLHN